ncbi:dienelactone hydrolase family protein [Bowmanella denitrificans]|uniref:dienelactone hydrolase family protein n=1 Tax=Bowmanella denitrificans TaxID=366582 RepID=UPI000C9D0E54|nr:dienelactone hydrolase family protein [Bowmanella denitrificans]
MHISKYLARYTALLALFMVSFTSSATGQRDLGLYSFHPITSYVTFSSADPNEDLTIAGQLSIPQVGNTAPLPAVVIVHSTAGIDSTGSFYAQALNKAGIATLEIDMWTARGLNGGSDGRPTSVPETMGDAFGALNFLTGLDAIDENRIGIIGFSWGGVMSMLSATKQYADLLGGGKTFAAHVAQYPVCWAYNLVPGYEFGELTGSPVMLQAGTLDTYDAPTSCKQLVNSLPTDDREHVKLNLYYGATHAWDRLEPQITVFDPYACQGAGCEVDFVPNLFAAWLSQVRVVDFFQRAFD